MVKSFNEWTRGIQKYAESSEQQGQADKTVCGMISCLRCDRKFEIELTAEDVKKYNLDLEDLDAEEISQITGKSALCGGTPYCIP